MRHNSFNRLLRTEASEMADGGGAAPVAAAPVAAAAEPPAAAAAPPREPTMLEKVQAAIRDKGTILAENHGFKAEILTLQGTLTARETTIATLTAQVQSLTEENTQLQQDFQSIDAALKATENKVVSIDTAAARQLAGMGYEAAALPAAETAPQETFETLKAKIETETDPAKLWALTEKLEALLAAT